MIQIQKGSYNQLNFERFVPKYGTRSGGLPYGLLTKVVRSTN